MDEFARIRTAGADERTARGGAAAPMVVHLAQCKLAVIKGRERGREYLVSGDVIRVGKSDDNDLVLNEETVSRVHLEILRDQKGYLLRDLHSTNGTFLDGSEIREAYIRAGSVITVGTVQLKFQPFEERIEVAPSEAESCGELVGRSPRMREVFGFVARIGPTDATVLVEGEVGVGKEAVARALHAHSRRKGGPFVVVDCSLPGPALEAELLGHEKGAASGAGATRQGAFELAQGGTLLLDEVGEIGLDLQPKLLRILEQRELRRQNGTRAIKLDVRVIATTRRSLRAEVERGKLRDDLFFRLSVVPLRVPPLRERRDDIPLLARAFAERATAVSARAAAGGQPVALDGPGEAALAIHDWPGNVRELRAVVERGLGLGLPAPDGISVDSPAVDLAFDPRSSYRDHKDRFERDFERRYLKWLLGRAEGNISRAARDADMDRKYLHKLLKKHAIVT